MRPLRPSSADRPAPAAVRAGGFAWTRVPGRLFARWRRAASQAPLPAARRRGAARRKPAPAWRRPALVAAVVLVATAGATGGGLLLWTSGAMHAAGAAVDRTVVAGMVGLGLTVEELNVEGRSITPRKELLSAVGVRRGDPILLFDVEAARRRVEQIGWVKSASVQRLLPGTILLHIVERQPFARWQIDGRTVLIDRDGKVLAQGDLPEYRRLRRVVGRGAADQVGRLFDVLMTEPAMFEHVRTAIRVRERRWDLELANGMTVRLPEESAETAWRHLAILQREQNLLGKNLVAIDMRLPDRLVMRLAPEAAAALRTPAKATTNGRGA